MNKKSKIYLWKKVLSLMLVFAMCLTGTGLSSVGNVKAEAAGNVKSITSAADLQKIGVNDEYPLDGDYVLANDIDMSGINFTPIGGGEGERGASSGKNVFTGTFNGQGHTIFNLKIHKEANSSVPWQYGLFGMIGSSDASDKAVVENLILEEIDIDVDMTAQNNEAYLSLGGLAGEVNTYAEINNVAIVGGAVKGNTSNNGDVVGVGGLIGEMRPSEISGVTVSNVYVSADVTAGSSKDNNYTGGIIGRIAKVSPESINACVFTGKVSFQETNGFGISFWDVSQSSTGSITNCYYCNGSSGTGTQVTKDQLEAGTLLTGLEDSYWIAESGQSLMLAICVGPEKMQEILALSALQPVFAKGDSSSAVTGNFTVPMTITIGEGEENVEWSSDKSAVLSFGTDGTVTVTPVLVDTDCVLTAVTRSGKTKNIYITVKSNISLKIDQEYATIDQPLTASLEGIPESIECTYEWRVDGTSKGSESSYTPTADDLEKMLTVTAEITENGQKIGNYGPVEMYISKLPVVYINTDSGLGITSKYDYVGANMRIQGNERFKDETLYDGKIEIRGRGNTSWSFAFPNGKLPYKIKLDKKADLLGFGENKHWAFLANYMEESLLRNKTSYDLAGEMGIEPHLPSANVDLIFNGKYVGSYQLVGNVRIHETRVNIFNWEDEPAAAAKVLAPAIAADNPNTTAKNIQKDLEDALNEDMAWITSDSVTYKGKKYKVSDYYTGIPKNAKGGIDVSGGFLYELDEYFDEASTFRTTSNQPMMFKAPEFAVTNNELFGYAQKYIQAFEDSVHAKDFYVNIEKQGSGDKASEFTEDYEGKKHYTDLVDMDSLVSYLLLNEFYWNTETMKKSTFMYKDLGIDNKLHIGPVWDMDWTSASLVSSSSGSWNDDGTDRFDVWMVTNAGQNAQKESWYRYLIGDPYFVEKLYECYWENREHFYDIVKENGIIDEEQAYIQESGEANHALPNILYGRCNCDFTYGVSRLKTFLTNRLNWLDERFGYTEETTPDVASSKKVLDALLESFEKYQDDTKSISVSVDTSNETATTYTAAVSDESIQKVGFYINGILAGTQAVANGEASLTVSDGKAGLIKDQKEYANNVVQVRAMIGEQALNSSNYALFQKEITAEPLTGTVEIQGLARAGSTLKAVVSDSNNSGTLSYQWKAGGKNIDHATQESYKLTNAEAGKAITVEVTSSWETGSITSEATEPVVQVVLANDHIIINQVYGDGGKDDSAVSHSFIELYNPTEQEISLEGYSLSYYSNGKDGATTEEGVTLDLDAAKKIPANCSYLIRCKAEKVNTTFYLTIDKYDQEWEQTIDNKQFKFLLYDKDKKLADGVSVDEGNIEEEGEQIVNNKIISKQKSIRRKDFADTNNNVEDFESVDYQTAVVKDVRPRCLADGPWGIEEPEPEPEVLNGSVSIRGNAITGAILYADVAGYTDDELENLKLNYVWKVDTEAITNTTGAFLVLNKSYEGKRISVTVTAGKEGVSGELTAPYTGFVTPVSAQREHLIINQVYGGGGKGDTPVSHSFIELYNPTAEEIDLTDYSISYLSGGSEATTGKLTGSIPSRTSYLIQCKKETTSVNSVTITNPDFTWNQVINNKKYRIILKKGENEEEQIEGEQIDAVSVNEAAAEGTALTDASKNDTIISKQKAIRRIGFIDTNDNVSDFEVLNYSKLPTSLIDQVKPRNSKYGEWGLEKESDEKDPNEKDPDEKDPDEKDPDDKDLTEKEPTKKDPDPQLVQAAENKAAEAEKKEEVQYTVESWSVLQAAKTALANALASKDEAAIQAAIRQMDAALAGLKTKDTSGEKKVPEVNTSFQYKDAWYRVTKSDETAGTVIFVKPVKTTSKQVVIPDVAETEGIKFKVTEIAANAFKNNRQLKKVTIGQNVEKIGASAFAGDKKLKNIVVLSNVIKSVGKKALNGIHANCKIKVPKKKLNAYKKKFKKKGQKSSVKIVK